MSYKFLISLMTVVALPNVFIILAVLLYIAVSSFDTLDIQAIGSGVSIYAKCMTPMFIPWHNTQSLSKGIVSLNRMYNSLDATDPLKLFLDAHCKHLLKPLEGSSGIPTEYSKPEVLLNLPNTVKLAPTYTPSQFDGLPGTVGIYVFYLEGEERVAQCGSSMNFSNRMRNHYRDGDKGVFIFKVRSHEDFHWTPLAYSKDYVALFNKDNNMTAEQEKILSSFTEQEVRSLEQAYTTYAAPTNYKGIPIHTSHNGWQVGDTHGKSDGKRITWTTQDGDVHTRWSMSSSLTELGYTLAYIKKVAQSNNPYLNTDKYGLVKISIDNLPMSETVQDVRYGTPLNNLVDKTDLLTNKYYLYSTDMQQLPYGPYNTVKETNLAMGLDANYSGTYLWVNYLHTVEATGLGIKVYVVKGISTSQIPILVEDLDMGNITEYKSITAALKELWPNNRGGYLILKAMVTKKPLTTPMGKYLFTFKYEEHLAVSIQKYNAHKQTKHLDKITY